LINPWEKSFHELFHVHAELLLMMASKKTYKKYFQSVKERTDAIIKKLPKATYKGKCG